MLYCGVQRSALILRMSTVHVWYKLKHTSYNYLKLNFNQIFLTTFASQFTACGVTCQSLITLIVNPQNNLLFTYRFGNKVMPKSYQNVIL